LDLRHVKDNVHEKHGKQEADPDPCGEAEEASGGVRRHVASYERRGRWMKEE
jgi:hypothetical protein